ncbi:MAG TPA: hypothetical protein PLC99_25455 [Verrucomicrobiota bacterium]|nr:hypothetical protein [Verrucomicrobiota bacterium]
MKKTLPQSGRNQERFLKDLEALWPLAKGSLAQVRKPCIRKSCPACARGDKHPAFIFTFTRKGKRKCMHVPKSLVPELRKAIANGRRLQDMISQAGIDMILDSRKNSSPPAGG